MLVSSMLVSGQTRVIIYDGYTGIYSTFIQHDTASVATLIPGSPAEKAGIRHRDQIIAINDSVVAGIGIGRRELQDLLFQRSGEPIDLLIRRKGEDSLLHFSFNRAPYMNQITAYEFEYLVDSLEQLDISDIMSDSLDSLFINPLLSKCRIYSIEEGSPAAGTGLLPGDLVVSMMDEMDKDYYLNLSSDIFRSMAVDTSFTILRGNSLIEIHLQPPVSKSLDGLRSQFSKDFSYPCAWLKVKTVNRITENRTYLVNLPEMSGTDSANFYFPLPSGNIVERRSGILIPVEERDVVLKNWHASTVQLENGAEQTFYIRWKSSSEVGAPLMNFIAQETIVQHDRVERMVLFALLGMMIIISCFFLILYFALHDRQYIYFSLYILFFAIFLFLSEGYLGEFYWKANVLDSILFTSAESFAISLVSVFFLLFGISYMELKRNLPGWYWAVVVVLGLIGVRVLTVMLGSLMHFKIGGIFEGVVVFAWVLSISIIPLLLLIIPAIYRIRDGFRPAWYFLIANVVLIPLAIITFTTFTFTFTSDTVNESTLVRILKVSGVYIATILQILIFSIGLARKMRLDEKEKKIAQRKIIDQLKENEKLKDKVNRELEQKVRERTREISEQKEEIESQRDEIEAQRDLLFVQKKEITDSIGYAQRIQAAILPHKAYMDQVIHDYFVLFKPRDVVSGDFYWVKEVDSSIVIVAADCTGHGVPGAFMSMLGITLLNELIVSGNMDQPGRILGQLRSKVKAMLVQEGNIRDQKDGMDMAIAVIDKKKRELQFAGAYNPLYLIRDRENLTGNEPGLRTTINGEHYVLFELKGDKQPIGIHWEETDFSTRKFSLKEKDTLYVFSDGYIDQYGGDQRKKFKSRKFKELLLSIQSESMEIQKKRIEETFENWRGNIDQIDDVCVIGVKV